MIQNNIKLFDRKTSTKQDHKIAFLHVTPNKISK